MVMLRKCVSKRKKNKILENGKTKFVDVYRSWHKNIENGYYLMYYHRDCMLPSNYDSKGLYMQESSSSFLYDNFSYDEKLTLQK